MGLKGSKYVVKEDYTAPQGQKSTNNAFQIKKDGFVYKLKKPRNSLYPDDEVCYVEHPITKQRDYVPRCIIGKKGTLDEYSWYFGKIGRAKAIQFLSCEYNTDGSFLIRDCDQGISINVGSHTNIYLSLSDLVDAAIKNDIPRLKDVRLRNVCQRPKPTILPREDVDKWIIPIEDLEILNPLSQGNFGMVSKGIWRGTRDVAIKTLINRPNHSSEKMQEEFRKEQDILRLLNHPHLVQVFGFVVDITDPKMVMEFLDKGDLRSYLISCGKQITFDTIMAICENVASGMKRLEHMKIVHRDLAARNVMLDKYMQAKVGDFGLARQGEMYEDPKAKFPIQWTAPEASRKRQFTHKSDVWSFGIVLWEIFALGETPYTDMSSDSICPRLLEGYRLPMPKKKVKADEKDLNKIHNIMLMCWLKDPNGRPTFESLHDDFSNFSELDVYDYSATMFMEQNDMHTKNDDKEEGSKKKRSKEKSKSRDSREDRPRKKKNKKKKSSA